MRKHAPPSRQSGLRQRKTFQRGFVLIAVMLMIAGLLSISLVSVRQAIRTSDHVQRDYYDDRVFNVAEGGADVAQAWLMDLLAVNSNPSQAVLSTFVPPTVTHYSYPELSITKQTLISGVEVSRGAFSGLVANIQPYEILSRAANANLSNEKVVRVTVNQEAVGLHQFGIYYDGDLEIMPSFPLDYNGRIHTNGNLYVGSHNTLDLESQITAAGHIYNTPKDPTQHFNGKARAKNSAGHWKDLSYDSTDPDWVEKSLDDWNGNVQDSAHGVTELPFPLPTTSDAHDIIERGTAGDSPAVRDKKYYYKAGLKIIDGVATDSAGNTVTLPSGILSSSSVYDYREGHNMAMRDLKISELISQNKVPANRVIYISYSHTNAAVRITNAEALPQGGIVIATDNPLYVQGHYNRNNKQPSSILCDAFNVYSSDWHDADATKALNKRIAGATTVNTCTVTGNKTTTSGNYSGGAENLIRLHEKWVGHQLTYRGSLICLWESEQATGDWEDASYVEGQRDWGFDPDLLDPTFWPEDNMSATRIARGSWRPY